MNHNNVFLSTESEFAFSNKIFAKLYAHIEYVSQYFKIQSCLFRVAQRAALFCNNIITMAILFYAISHQVKGSKLLQIFLGFLLPRYPDITVFLKCTFPSISSELFKLIYIFQACLVLRHASVTLKKTQTLEQSAICSRHYPTCNLVRYMTTKRCLREGTARQTDMIMYFRKALYPAKQL